MAEVGRNPSTSPEAPTEIVGAGRRSTRRCTSCWRTSASSSTSSSAGPSSPPSSSAGASGAPGIVWFLIKIVAVYLFTQWARSAVPRVRIDQLIEIGWKGLLVLSFANVVHGGHRRGDHGSSRSSGSVPARGDRIGILKSMATTMKHALDGETFTVEYPDVAPEVSPRFPGSTSSARSGASGVASAKTSARTTRFRS